MFVICPPQTYIYRVQAGWHYASYWEFWGTIFNMVRYPEGNLSWWHLWFLPYILTYSLLVLILHAWLRAPAGRAFSDGLARLCERHLSGGHPQHRRRRNSRTLLARHLEPHLRLGQLHRLAADLPVGLRDVRQPAIPRPHRTPPPRIPLRRRWDDRPVLCHPAAALSRRR